MEDLNPGTAIVKINPEGDIAILSLLGEANKLRDFALTRIISSDADLTPASNDMLLISKVKKAILGKKEEYIRPLKNYQDSINAVFNLILDPLKEADDINQKKMLDYRDAKFKRIQEIAKLNQDALDVARRQAEASDTGEFTADTTPIEVPEVISKIRTEMGSISTMKVPRWELVNFILVPDEYKEINAGKVTKIVKAGLRNIPGLRIWVEETLRRTTQ